MRVEHARTQATLATTAAINIATDLIETYPDGHVLSPHRRPRCIDSAPRQVGVRRGNDHSTWARHGRTVRVFVPEGARGLEFDAVVVVEPIDFPENLGRAGQLYTSLTRANRELAVVWHRALPDPLRRAAR